MATRSSKRSKLKDLQVVFALLLIVVAIMSLFATSVVFNAQNCETGVSSSPRASSVSKETITEPSIAIPFSDIIASDNHIPVDFKLIDYNGYLTLFINKWNNLFYNYSITPSYTTITTPYGPQEISYILTLNSYFAGHFKAEEEAGGDLVIQNNEFYWGDSSASKARTLYTELNGTGIALYFTAFSYVINNTSPSSLELQNAIYLDIAPLFTLEVYNDQGVLLDSYVAKSVFVVPSLLLSFIDYINNSGGTINYIKENTELVDQDIHVTYNTGVFNIMWSMTYTVEYNNTQVKTFNTIMIAYGNFALSPFKINTTLFLLDLTSYNNMLLTSAKAVPLYVVSSATTGLARESIVKTVSFTLVNATNTSQILFNNNLNMILYDDYIAASTNAPSDAILFTDFSDPSFNSLLLSDKNTVYMIEPNGITKKVSINETYLASKLSSSNLTLVNAQQYSGVSFLPVIVLTHNNNGYNYTNYGLAFIYSVRATYNNRSVLFIAPYFFYDISPPGSSPPKYYSKIINNNIPYVIYLPYEWSNITNNGMTIISSQILSYINDTTNNFLGGYEPILDLIVKASQKITTPYISYENRVIHSLSLPELIAFGAKTNITSVNTDTLYNNGIMTPVLLNSDIHEYLFGKNSNLGKTIWNLPGTWIRMLAEEMNKTSYSVALHYYSNPLNPEDHRAVRESYGSLPGLSYNDIFTVLGTTYYEPTALLPTLYYSMLYNNITGTPILSMNINTNSTGNNTIPYYFIIGKQNTILKHSIPGELYYNGANGGLIDQYTVALKIYAKPIETSRLGVPIIANGMIIFGYQGVAFNKTLVIAPVLKTVENAIVKNYTVTVSGGTTSTSPVSPAEENNVDLGSGFFIHAYASLSVPVASSSSSVKPNLTISFNGYSINVNTTFNPGSYIVVVDHNASSLNNIFIDPGNAKSIIAYYFDPNAKALLAKNICDGDCASLASSSQCKSISIAFTDPSLSPSNTLVMIQVNTTSNQQTTTTTTGGINLPGVPTITLPESPGSVSTPSIATASGLMTVLLFIVFYIYYNNKMSQAQALAVSVALAGLASIIIFGTRYLTTVIILFGVGIALYYVLGK